MSIVINQRLEKVSNTEAIDKVIRMNQDDDKNSGVKNDEMRGPICDYDELTREPQVFAASDVARTGVILFIKNQSIMAYENVCPHAFARLDFANTKIVAFDGYHILCNVHGAQFDPSSGTCVIGPCVGARLTSLNTKIINQKVYIVKSEN